MMQFQDSEQTHTQRVCGCKYLFHPYVLSKFHIQGNNLNYFDKGEELQLKTAAPYPVRLLMRRPTTYPGKL